MVTDDAGVVRGVGRAWCVACRLMRWRRRHRVEEVAPAQLVGHGDRVDGIAAGGEDPMTSKMWACSAGRTPRRW